MNLGHLTGPESKEAYQTLHGVKVVSRGCVASLTGLPLAYTGTF